MIWKEFYGKDLVSKSNRRARKSMSNDFISAPRNVVLNDPIAYLFNNPNSMTMFQRRNSVGNHFDVSGVYITM